MKYITAFIGLFLAGLCFYFSGVITCHELITNAYWEGIGILSVCLTEKVWK